MWRGILDIFHDLNNKEIQIKIKQFYNNNNKNDYNNKNNKQNNNKNQESIEKGLSETTEKKTGRGMQGTEGPHKAATYLLQKPPSWQSPEPSESVAALPLESVAALPLAPKLVAMEVVQVPVAPKLISMGAVQVPVAPKLVAAQEKKQNSIGSKHPNTTTKQNIQKYNTKKNASKKSEHSQHLNSDSDNFSEANTLAANIYSKTKCEKIDVDKTNIHRNTKCEKIDKGTGRGKQGTEGLAKLGEDLGASRVGKAAGPPLQPTLPRGVMLPTGAEPSRSSSCNATYLLQKPPKATSQHLHSDSPFFEANALAANISKKSIPPKKDLINFKQLKNIIEYNSNEKNT